MIDIRLVMRAMYEEYTASTGCIVLSHHSFIMLMCIKSYEILPNLASVQQGENGWIPYLLSTLYTSIIIVQ